MIKLRALYAIITFFMVLSFDAGAASASLEDIGTSLLFSRARKYSVDYLSVPPPTAVQLDRFPDDARASRSVPKDTVPLSEPRSFSREFVSLRAIGYRAVVEAIRANMLKNMKRSWGRDRGRGCPILF